MIYISIDYIISAIKQLSTIHPFLGITFLTCKKNNLVVGKQIPFPMDTLTKAFMQDIHAICPTSKYYFQPYQTVKKKFWLAEKYPSSGLQAINTQTFRSAFLHKSKDKKWGWSEDYVNQIGKIAIQKEEDKIPLSAIAVWVLKNEEWEDTSNINDVVNSFIEEYNITTNELSVLFSKNSNFPPVPAFQNELCSWNQLSNMIPPPPDAKPEQEGTLSKLELINVGPSDHIDISFSPRLNILTGDNGLGKTFILDCAWWALTNTWTGNEARPKYSQGSRNTSITYSISGKSKITQENKILFDNKNITWHRSNTTDTIPGLIIYAMVDGSYAVWDPSKLNTNIEISNVFTREQIWNGKDNKIEGLIRDWVKWQNSPDKYPFEIFTQVLKCISPPDLGNIVPGESVRVPFDSREIPTIIYPYGTVPITNSSAGVSRIVTLAYLIVWAWNEHKETCKLRGIKPDSRIVIIIDELEAHLHPKWQRTILPALIEAQKYLANELEVQFIIATHSPLIMASVEPIFDFNKDKLFKINLDESSSNAILEEEEFIKYGQINSWLTSNIFNLGQARSIVAEQTIEKAKALQLEEEPDDQEVQKVHIDLTKCLSQTDTFWPRWIYFAEQHGVKV